MRLAGILQPALRFPCNRCLKGSGFRVCFLSALKIPEVPRCQRGPMPLPQIHLLLLFSNLLFQQLMASSGSGSAAASISSKKNCTSSSPHQVTYTPTLYLTIGIPRLEMPAQMFQHFIRHMLVSHKFQHVRPFLITIGLSHGCLKARFPYWKV